MMVVVQGIVKGKLDHLRRSFQVKFFTLLDIYIFRFCNAFNKMVNPQCSEVILFVGAICSRKRSNARAA